SRNGGGTGPPGVCPVRAPMSAGFTHAAWTRTTTWPAAATGSGRSTTCRTSGPPIAMTATARIDVSFDVSTSYGRWAPPSAIAVGREPWAACGAGREDPRPPRLSPMDSDVPAGRDGSDREHHQTQRLSQRRTQIYGSGHHPGGSGVAAA